MFDLNKDKYSKDFVSGGRLLQRVTDEGMKELANISVRLAIMSLSKALRSR